MEYEYQYLSVEGEGIVSVKFPEVRGLIDQEAAKGWRYAGWVPAHIGRDGAIAKIDLIFEREKS